MHKILIFAFVAVLIISGCHRSDSINNAETSAINTETVQEFSTTPLEVHSLAEETTILVEESSESRNYIVPERVFSALPLIFGEWRKDDTDYRDGIWYGRFYKPFVPVIEILTYKDMDDHSEIVRLSTDNVYYAIASDGKNWIYMADDDGRGGWLYIDESGVVRSGDDSMGIAEAFIVIGDGETEEKTIELFDLPAGILDEQEDYRVTDYESSDDMISAVGSLGVEQERIDVARAKIDNTEGIKNKFNKIYIFKVPGKLLDTDHIYDERNNRMIIFAFYEEGSEAEYCQLCTSMYGGNMGYYYISVNANE